MKEELSKALLDAVSRSQMVLFKYVKPDPEITAEACINELLAILDDQKLVAMVKNYQE